MKRQKLDPDAVIESWRARGLDFTVTHAKPGPAGPSECNVANWKPKRKTKDLLPSVFVPPNAFVVGIETRSEANNAGSRHASIGRKARQRDAVQRLLAMHWSFIGPIGDAARAGKPVTIKLARLGGRSLDRHDNLPRSLKAVADGVCLQLGIQDNLPNLTFLYEQHLSERMGVRIILEAQ